MILIAGTRAGKFTDGVSLPGVTRQTANEMMMLTLLLPQLLLEAQFPSISNSRVICFTASTTTTSELAYRRAADRKPWRLTGRHAAARRLHRYEASANGFGVLVKTATTGARILQISVCTRSANIHLYINLSIFTRLPNAYELCPRRNVSPQIWNPGQQDMTQKVYKPRGSN